MNTDLEQLENLRQWRLAESNNDSLALIKCYVPESEYLGFDDALELALRRDEQRAYELVATESAI